MSPTPNPSAAGFPPVYATQSTEHLLEVFSEGAARVTQAIDGLREEELTARPRPEKWSIQEIALHLTDSELVGAIRIRKVLSEDRPPLPSYDQDAFARSLAYRDLGSSFRRATLHTFRNLRETSAELFRRASLADWRREGIHPEWGAMTLRQLLELYADHSERHLGQILEARRLLDRALAMTLRLPARLY